MRGQKTGGGSRQGIPNKATAEVRELARAYGPAALKELARLATKAESETARVTACNAILDRAYGKAAQPVEHELDVSNLTDEQIAALAALLGATAAAQQGAGGDRAAPTLN